MVARAIRTGIAAFFMVFDTKDKVAAEFYLHHGFIAFAGRPLSLFLPLATVSALKP